MVEAMTEESRQYLYLLAGSYPTAQAAFSEIINLSSILNLPKGTEHFISDLHGEYEAFTHILNNCSGVVREKIELLFRDQLSRADQSDLCTLIYYPKKKLEKVKKEGRATPEWYVEMLHQMIELARLLASKYPWTKVKRALPSEFSYIIVELMHAQPDEDNNQLVYHEKIIESILHTQSADEFICALAGLIKRLAVDHLHIVGDIFDRGSHPDKILDMLMNHHSLDIQWGNHDILWMGAAAGSDVCIAAVIRNNLVGGNIELLESGYGVSLRALHLFAERVYASLDAKAAAIKAINVLLFKLEGQLILRNPEYDMSDRLLLDKIDYHDQTVTINGEKHLIRERYFPTVQYNDPYALTKEEKEVMLELRQAFLNSVRLHTHVKFLYKKGGMYSCYNQNLLFHGCIPLDEDGNLDEMVLDGVHYVGKAWLDYADRTARQAYFDKREQSKLDFMWYLWCGKKSPLSGRTMKTFERAYIENKDTWKEPVNPYFKYCNQEVTCTMILREFGLYSPHSHIINGHTPVKVVKGESPVKAGGKLIVIDGGFCKSYQKKTGIAGYTLIYNSHGLRIKAHQPFSSIEKVLNENRDINSDNDILDTYPKRVMIADTDAGKHIKSRIEELEKLLSLYRQGFNPSDASREAF